MDSIVIAWIDHNDRACQTLDPPPFAVDPSCNPVYLQRKFICCPGGRIFPEPHCAQFEDGDQTEGGAKARVACLKFGTRLRRAGKFASPVIKMTRAHLACRARRPARQIFKRIRAAAPAQLDKLVRWCAAG
jgi:hypothetical protein